MMLMIRAIFNALINALNLVYGVIPTSANGVAAAAVTLTSAAVAWTWAVAGYVQIAASVGAADVQVYGLTLENFVGAASQGEVSIGTGLAGFEVEIARVPAVNAGYFFPKPIKVPAGTRIAGRYRTSTGAADSVDCKLLTLTGF